MKQETLQICPDDGLKSRKSVLASAAMLMPAALMFLVASDLPHVFFIVCSGLILSLAVRTPLKFTDRTVTYSIVASMTLAVILDMLFPMKPLRFFSLGRVMMFQVTAPLLLFLGVISTFYEPGPYLFGINAAFSMVVMMLCGDYRLTAAAGTAAGNSMLLNKFRENFDVFFISSTAFFCLSMLYSFSLTGKSFFHKSSRGLDRAKTLMLALSALASVMLAAGAIKLFDIYRNDIRKLENYLTSLARSGALGSSNVLFGDEVDLNTTISDSFKNNMKTVMLRVRGPHAPGYLRGRAYQHYSNGLWRDSQEPPAALGFELNVENLAVSAFFPGDRVDAHGKNRFDIYHTLRCHSDYLFLPPQTQRLELVAEKVESSANGLLRPTIWEPGAGYSAMIDGPAVPSAFPMPRDFTPQDYLHIPKSALQAVSGLAEEAGINAAPSGISESEVIDMINTVLKNKFSYSLSPEPPKRGVDPISNFINTSRKGHCELFATAATLLLRHAGIPSRYVTGFVCTEQHPSGNYFVARGGDAHAWCEAYLEDGKGWVLVDPTPADDVERSGSYWGLPGALFDGIQQAFQQLLADVKRGYVARAVISFIVALFHIVIETLRNPIPSALLIAAAAFFALHFLRRRKNHDSSSISLDEIKSASSRELLDTIHYISRKTRVHRKPGQTVTEWWCYVSEYYRLPDSITSQFYSILSSYRMLRFSSAPYETSCIPKLRDECKTFKKSFGKNNLRELRRHQN